MPKRQDSLYSSGDEIDKAPFRIVNNGFGWVRIDERDAAGEWVRLNDTFLTVWTAKWWIRWRLRDLKIHPTIEYYDPAS